MDELYVVARRVLLDVLNALGTHKEATILVGAQAVYLHTGDAEMAVAEYTTDADLAFDPALLADRPSLETALEAAGLFAEGGDAVGVWKTHRPTSFSQETEVQVDLLVPATVSPGRGRRAARLAGHGSGATRKVDGLEGVLVDLEVIEIGSLEPHADPRSIALKVAGPAGLLIAKLHKIDERLDSPREVNKDALDVLRLLQAIETQELLGRWSRIVRDPRSEAAGTRATDLLHKLFGTRGSAGSVMASRAVAGLMDEDEVRLSCEVLAQELLAGLRGQV